MIKAKLILIAIALLAVIFLWAYIDALRTQRNSHKKIVQAYQRHILDLELAIEANKIALVEREKEKVNIEAEREMVICELNKIYESDYMAESWANTAIPGNILGRLR